MDGLPWITALDVRELGGIEGAWGSLLGGGRGQRQSSASPRCRARSRPPSDFYLQSFVNDRKRRERKEGEIRGG